MKRNVFIRFIKENLPALCIFLLVFIVFALGTAFAGKTSREEGRKIAADSISRAVVSCYAAEGFYPDSLEYLVENYGLHIDDSRYTVHYDIIAANIMPDITVIEKQR